MKLASIVLAAALLVVPPPVTTVGRGADGRVVVPTGQVLAPAGRRIESKLCSQLSMVHTAEAVLGLPPMNRFDASSPVMTAALTTKLNLTPYTAIPPNLPLDQMNAPITRLSGIVRTLAVDATHWNVNRPDSQPASEMRASIWLATHPHSRRPLGQGASQR